MSVSASPRLAAYTALTVVALVAALAAGRPELAALAIPFALMVAVALTDGGPPSLRGSLRLERDRAL